MRLKENEERERTITEQETEDKGINVTFELLKDIVNRKSKSQKSSPSEKYKRKQH